MEGRFQFSSPEWDDRSDTVKDLVRLMRVSFEIICAIPPSSKEDTTIPQHRITIKLFTIILLLRYLD